MFIVDSGGFRDLRGIKVEIFNMTTLYYLLTANEDKSPITVLLVVSGTNFDRCNINGLIDSYKTLLDMFPNFNQIKNALGLVITMAEPGTNA